MKIVLWGINYTPEVTGIAPFNSGLAEFLSDSGHAVEVVTTFPYYPAWRKLPRDRGRLYRTDTLEGVKVIRSWHYVPSAVTTLRRMVHELSFGVTSFFRVLTSSKLDVVIVVSPPLLLGPLAVLACWIRRRPFVFHVQDLQPDAAVGLGMVKVGILTKLLYLMEAWSYSRSRMVSGISAGIMSAFQRKGVPAVRRVFFPNWIRWYGENRPLDLSDDERTRRAQAFRVKFRVPVGSFLAVYSGNIGRKQGLEHLIGAVEQLERDRNDALGPVEGEAGRPIRVLLVGDGAMRKELEERVARTGLAGLQMLPLLLEDDYLGLLLAADVSLILQAPGTGQYFFPSKLLSVLSAGCPVITAADESSELAKAVAEGCFGINVPAAQPGAIVAALRALAGDPDRLAALRGATSWVNRFRADVVLPAYEARLRAAVDLEGDPAVV